MDGAGAVSLGLNHLQLSAAHPAFSSCPAGPRLSRDPIHGLWPTHLHCVLLQVYSHPSTQSHSLQDPTHTHTHTR